MYTLHINQITQVVEIRKGFEVDYSGKTPVNFNNHITGKWGTIVNEGEVVDYAPYNPNRWYGEGSFPEVESTMKNNLLNLNSSNNS